MKTLKTLIFALIPAVLLPLHGFAADRPEIGLYRADGTLASTAELLDQVTPGTILLLGEQHLTAVHSTQHVAVLESLRAKGLKVSVGMEFVAYPFQNQCNLWRTGAIDEETFLREVGWGKMGVEFYRRQMLFPDYAQGEWLIALNAPRSLTSRIAKVGVEKLTEDEKSILPPNFVLGNSGYFERFKKSIGHVPDPQKELNYFAAQSAWDDTMAWKAVDFIRSHPDQVLVIVVGEFHVQYGGGLPDRLRARLNGADHRVISVSQVNIFDMDDEQARQSLMPSSEYGPRADWIWLSSFQN